MGYPTPETLPTARVCRQLSIPNDPVFLGAFTGALFDLTFAENWEAFGAVTPEDAAAAAFDVFQRYLVPVACMLGSILPYATTTPPQGTLACDGASYLRADYPQLYSMLDAVYIVDADTFRTPDLRGRVIVGVGSGDGLSERNIGDIGGEEAHQLTVGELANHAHTVNMFAEELRSGAVTLHPFLYESLISPANTNATGDDEPHNTMQPFHVLNYCMVAR